MSVNSTPRFEIGPGYSTQVRVYFIRHPLFILCMHAASR